MEIKIRELTKEDISAILEIVGLNFEGHIESAKRDLHLFFSREPSIQRQFFVAVHKNQIVGCVGFAPDEDEDVEEVYWACWLYVRPEYHNQGVGSLLWSELEDRLKKLKARKLYLDVGNETDQSAATAFYLNRGFIKEGELIDYFKDGENMQIFAKRLR